MSGYSLQINTYPEKPASPAQVISILSLVAAGLGVPTSNGSMECTDGIVLGGASNFFCGKHMATAGGFILGGNSAATKESTFVALGGMVIGNSTPISIQLPYTLQDVSTLTFGLFLTSFNFKVECQT